MTTDEKITIEVCFGEQLLAVAPSSVRYYRPVYPVGPVAWGLTRETPLVESDVAYLRASKAGRKRIAVNTSSSWGWPVEIVK